MKEWCIPETFFSEINNRQNLNAIVTRIVKKELLTFLISIFENGDFSETSHRDCDGDVGILEIIRAYHDGRFDGYIRPDHGRHIWNEKCRPGYGLYDRALGIMYILGAWDMLDRLEGKA